MSEPETHEFIIASESDHITVSLPAEAPSGTRITVKHLGGPEIHIGAPPWPLILRGEGDEYVLDIRHDPRISAAPQG